MHRPSMLSSFLVPRDVEVPCSNRDLRAVLLVAVACLITTTSYGEPFAYVTNTGSDDATIPVGNNPGYDTLTPNGAFAYVTHDNISVIDTATNAVIGTIPGVATNDIAVTPNGAWAHSTIPVGDLPYGVSITPDGNSAHVASWEYNLLEGGGASVTQAIPAIQTIGTTGVHS